MFRFRNKKQFPNPRASDCANNLHPGASGLDVSVDERIERVIAHLEANLHHRPPVPELAGRVGLSYGHFAVVFRAATGCSLTRYMKLARMRHAKALLADDSLNVKEIAERVGMDFSRFIREFREVYGDSPGRYRRSLPGNDGGHHSSVMKIR